jgi:hypothetical protein
VDTAEAVAGKATAKTSVTVKPRPRNRGRFRRSTISPSLFDAFAARGASRVPNLPRLDATSQGDGAKVVVDIGECGYCQEFAGEAVVSEDPLPPFHPSCTCTASAV